MSDSSSPISNSQNLNSRRGSSSDDSPPQDPNSQSFDPRLVCQYCYKMFSHPSSAREHRKIHFSPQYRCSEPGCDKRFHKKAKLKRHLLTHAQQYDFHCTECSSSFKRNLTANIRRKHIPISMRPEPRNSYFPISKRECGGASPRFSLKEFPRFVAFLDQKPTCKHAVTFLSRLVKSHNPLDSRVVTRSIVQRIALKNGTPLTHEPKIVYAPRPQEKPRLDPELTEFFRSKFLLREASDPQTRSRSFVVEFCTACRVASLLARIDML